MRRASYFFHQGRRWALHGVGGHGVAAGAGRKRVLVLDLDLESPGLSSALLPSERQPKYGITDWLIEDLLDSELTPYLATTW